MLRTVEMRWFLSDCPQTLLEWMQSVTATLQERSDWYAMPCHPDCGIKLREGKLETKLRSADLGMRSIGPVTGRLEEWKKWSLEFTDDKPPTDDELQAVGWWELKKRRYLVRFSIEMDHIRHSPVRPTSGCEFELTQLFLQEQEVWTVGFEAVGPADRIEQNLARAVLHALAPLDGLPCLRAANSFGYAHWLSQNGKVPSIE